jgi:heparinase II/III-like protein
VLETRLSEQFYSDGGSVEQAVVYHHATLGFYLLAALVGRNNGEEFSAGVWHAVERAIEFSMYLAQPDGRQPAVGDNDDARPFAFDLRDAWEFGHFQAAGAVLFDRPDFKSTHPFFGEDAFWLLGASAIPRFEAIVSRPPSRTSCVLAASGSVVLRSGWEKDDDYVWFDCGEQAGGLRQDDIPSAAHGHADALAIVACLRGRPILVDGGFYTYNRERAWERHFRETAAHNTVRIDGRDQSDHLETMAWVHAPEVSLDGFRLDKTEAWAIGSHNGYMRRPDGVFHRRTVWLRPGHYIVVNDVLSGSGTHRAEVVFQFHESLSHHLQAGRVILQDRFFVSWTATTTLEPAVYVGGDTPDSGWVAPRLGQRTPAARLVLRASFSDTLRVLTVIGDGAIWKSEAEPAVLDGRHALVQRLSGPDCTEDLIMASNGATDGGGAYQTDGSIGAWRFERGEIVAAAHAGGTFIAPTSGIKPARLVDGG